MIIYWRASKSPLVHTGIYYKIRDAVKRRMTVREF